MARKKQRDFAVSYTPPVHIETTHADRIVYPEGGRTKGDVVAYYERMADRMTAHVSGHPLSIRRFPRGVGRPGFFQNDVPGHYPQSLERVDLPKTGSTGDGHVTRVVAQTPDHVAYLAHQGAVEMHMSTFRLDDNCRPDRLVIDLDPPAGALALARRAAFIVRDALAELGLASIPVATGAKGYHVVAPLRPSVDAEAIGAATVKLTALLAHEHGDVLTDTFAIGQRGHRVYVDGMRNRTASTVVVPYSLKARPGATVAVPLSWDELDAIAPDHFTIDDVEALLARPDSFLALEPGDGESFVAALDARFAASHLAFEQAAYLRAVA